MIYKDTKIEKSGVAGVKKIHRGKDKGKFQAFYKNKNGLIFTGQVRDLKYQAVFDLSLLKARVYL